MLTDILTFKILKRFFTLCLQIPPQVRCCCRIVKLNIENKYKKNDKTKSVNVQSIDSE